MPHAGWNASVAPSAAMALMGPANQPAPSHAMPARSVTWSPSCPRTSS